MKILFTGASSFAGYWFVNELIAEGHEVIATFTAPNIESYQGIRKKRVALIKDKVKSFWDTKFGDGKFLELISTESKIDLLCHHAADVTNYKSDDFHIANALNNNTQNLNTVLDFLKEKGCNKIILSGSVFEQNEGTGSSPLVAFSPYGLSKSFTYEIFKYYSYIKNFQLGKFVIPNPFGPFEELRFTNYLITSWTKGETPLIKTPLYVRDNIHVSLLAKAYSKFVVEFLNYDDMFLKLNPSGYIETVL
jgi:nucleoside-diphosphate-sugar epimerase